GLRATTVLEPTTPAPTARESSLHWAGEARVRHLTGIHPDAGVGGAPAASEVRTITERKLNGRAPKIETRTDPAPPPPVPRPVPAPPPAPRAVEQSGSAPPENTTTPQIRAFDRDSFGGRR